MANQTISADTNHDALTGRASGEDITIDSGAVLTIDSEPHLTAMGVLGILSMTNGEILIDGTRTWEIAYSSGGGGALPAISAAVSWNGGADTGKVIKLDSGDAASGVMTITVDVGETTPDSADSITDGTWSADIDTIKQGYLRIHAEDQDWVGQDGRDRFTIQGAWYELGVGNGGDSQTFELPHIGWQHAIWVETGNGTGVYNKWHRIQSGASTAFFYQFSEFGASYENGMVFQQTIGDATVTFGTSTQGGVPANGAKLRIPSVHMETVTVGAPTTPLNSGTEAAYVKPIPTDKVTEVFIDYANFSTMRMTLLGTKGAEINHSCFGQGPTTTYARNSLPILIEDCAFVFPGTGTGGFPVAQSFTFQSAVNGIELTDNLWYAGVDANNVQALYLLNCRNVAFYGTNKVTSAIKDENTTGTLRVSGTPDGYIEKLIAVGGEVSFAAGSNRWQVDWIVGGLLNGRGTTEQDVILLSLSVVDYVTIDKWSLATGCKFGTSYFAVALTGNNNTIRNVGAVDAKIDCGARCTQVIAFGGGKNMRLQRIYLTNLNATDSFYCQATAEGAILQNISSDYDDPLNSFSGAGGIIRGAHMASGAVDSATGVDGDIANSPGTMFIDYFKSDTTGALGLRFNDPGVFFPAYFTLVAGTPLFNGLGHVLMRTIADQIIYEWPYKILGHTAFQNAAIELAGTNTANIDYEYSLKENYGDAWSAWTTASGANLSAETIAATGFYFRMRLTCNTTDATNVLKALAVLTSTTIAAQKANLYPRDVEDIVLQNVVDGSRYWIAEALTPANVIALGTQSGAGDITISGVEVTGNLLEIRVRKSSAPVKYKPFRTYGTLTAGGMTVYVAQEEDDIA